MSEVIDEKMSKEIISKTNKIYHAIYDDEKFKDLSQRYFQIHMIKENKTMEELFVPYHKFVQTVINEKFKNVKNQEDIRNIRKLVNDSTSKLKKRWFKSAMDSLSKNTNKYLNKEYLLLKEEYLKNKGHIVSENIDKPEDIIDIRESFLKQWSSSIIYNVSDFPYLSEMSLSKINSAFSYDLILCVTEILKNDYNYDLKNITISTPPGLPAGVFKPNGRNQGLNISKVRELFYKSEPYDAKNTDGNVLDVGYTFDAESVEDNPDDLRLLLNVLRNNETEKKARTQLSLDKQDLSIIRFAHSNSVLSYSKVYIADILKFLNLNNSSYNYKKIKDKLLKLPYYTFYTKEIDNNGNLIETTFNLFSKIRVKKDDTGRMIVEIFKSNNEEMDMISTQLMYRNDLKKLTSHTSVDLAYLLEGIRSHLVKTGTSLSDRYRLDIDLIKFHVNMSKKATLKQRLLELEKAFKEIVSNQFIIKEYYMGNSYFEVLFYDDIEKRQLLLDNTILSLPNYLSK